MNGTNSRYGILWSRNELILALYLYCQIPFSRTKANNPEVVRLANLIDRTPSSIARKLGNFGASDPLLAKEGIRGLTHASRMDREIWNEFYGRWDNLVDASQRILSTLPVEIASMEQEEWPIISRPSGPTERPASVLARLCQSFFRKTILSSYESSCCICGIDLVQLLVASHIVPWSANKDCRSDPENGLCLCSLHDKAFDRGLISIKTSLEILVSPLVRSSSSSFARYSLLEFHGKELISPRRFCPKPEYLQWHQENIFLAR